MSPLNAVQFLKSDHERIRNFFERVKQAESIDEKQDLFYLIREELDLHCHLEETVFYPSLGEPIELRDILEECYDEHQEITDLMEEMDETGDGDLAMFEDDLNELIEAVEFHFRREESELFDRLSGLVEPAQLSYLGAVLSESRHKLEAA